MIASQRNKHLPLTSQNKKSHKTGWKMLFWILLPLYLIELYLFLSALQANGIIIPALNTGEISPWDLFYANVNPWLFIGIPLLYLLIKYLFLAAMFGFAYEYKIASRAMWMTVMKYGGTVMVLFLIYSLYAVVMLDAEGVSRDNWVKQWMTTERLYFMLVLSRLLVVAIIILQFRALYNYIHSKTIWNG